MSVAVICGDMREALRDVPDNSVDSCVCDPPYHLTSIVKRFGSPDAAPCKVKQTGAFARASKGFMGQTWDGGDLAFQPDTWAEVFRVLKPGAHLLAFSGTRTYHRMTVAIEDAGFEVRDMVAWHYGSGFPKNHDMSKAIDRHLGVERPVVGKETLSNDIRGGALLDAQHGTIRPAFERDVTAAGSDEAKQWDGWGTALKPATEPICLARKPISEKSVAANVLKWGTGALNIDACRVAFAGGADEAESKGKNRHADFGSKPRQNAIFGADNSPRGVHGNYNPPGRWPANLVHDGSDEVVAGFPAEANGGHHPARRGKGGIGNEGHKGQTELDERFSDEGSAARFFYCAKAGKLDRLGSDHPTVKPVELMRWCVRLVTPPGGMVLDPFAGTGSTGIAAFVEGFDCTLVELREEAVADINRRLAHIQGLGRMTALETAKLNDPAKLAKAIGADTPLFAAGGGA